MIFVENVKGRACNFGGTTVFSSNRLDASGREVASEKSPSPLGQEGEKGPEEKGLGAEGDPSKLGRKGTVS